MTEAASRSLIDRLRGWRSLFWSDQEGNSTALLQADLPPSDVDRLIVQMRECLDAKGGEVSARVRAASLGRAYLGMNLSGRERFLRVLAHEFGTDRGAVDSAALRLGQAEDRAERLAAERDLRDALDAPRVKLLTQFSTLPDGVKFLVDLRSELINFTRKDPDFIDLEADLMGLLSSWFDLGFLELKRLTWHSPAIVLEKIMAYEAVHAIHSWDALKDRLDSDRRLYGFFHPRMPDEPLIFIEVALVRGMADSIQTLLDQSTPADDPNKADTAIFYSISNAQRGLAGISFGNFLIKRVVDNLAGEFPNLKSYATLSPMPGFRAWIEKTLATGEPGLLTAADHRALTSLSNGMGAKGSLKHLLALDQWHDDPLFADALKPILLRLGARYLSQTKRKDGRTLDPVAHFHLSNGARIERLNWLGDTSSKGMAQSAGLMVNYAYRLPEIEANHEAYSGKGKVAMSRGVKAMLEE
jgi:malonyl-CoA decarboxylase